MAIEQILTDLIAALNANTAALSKTTFAPGSGIGEAVAAAANAATPPKAARKKSEDKPAAAAAPAITAKQLADDFLKLADLPTDGTGKSGRDEAKSFLSQLGIAKLSELKADKYPAMLDLITAALARRAAAPEVADDEALI